MIWCLSTFLGFDDPKNIALVVGLILISFVLMRRSFKKLESDKRNNQKRPAEDTKSGKQPLRGEAEQLLVELQEFGREIEGRLETRIVHITKLISEGDRVIERLNAVVSAAENKQDSTEGKKEKGRQQNDLTKEKVLSLVKEGKKTSEIAGIVGKPLGEIELILGLEKKEKT